MNYLNKISKIDTTIKNSGDAVRYATTTNIVKKRKYQRTMSPANINKLRDSFKRYKTYVA